MPFLKLSKLIEDNWVKVLNQCNKSSISLSKPCSSQTRRAVDPEVPFNLQPIYQAALRASSRFILKTDITNFYPSIYTHSIAWALHTKQKAKVQRKPNQLLGNQFDKVIRQAQYAQSIGIPIGPDTSFIIAEMLLSSVDADFCTYMEEANLPINGHRSFDDYEFGFTSRADAESAIAILEGVLGEYELQLNPGKTTIVELPIPVEPSWISELRLFSFGPGSQPWRLRGYFDRAFLASQSNPDAEILKYAIQRLRSVKIAEDNWTLCEDFLLQSAMVEPSALPAIIDHLHYYKNENYPLDGRKIEEVFNILIGSHAPLGHGSEVAWILWACLLFSLTIGDKEANDIVEMEDPFVAILMLHAYDSNLTKSKIDFRNWKRSLTKQGLYDTQWVLSYEANVKGWLPAKRDHVKIDANFSVLKNNDVCFYDSKRVQSHTPNEHYDIVEGFGGTYSDGFVITEKDSEDEGMT